MSPNDPIFSWSNIQLHGVPGLLLVPLEDTHFTEERSTLLAQTEVVAPGGRESFIAMDLDRDRQMLVAGAVRALCCTAIRTSAASCASCASRSAASCAAASCATMSLAASCAAAHLHTS